jgi:hypothetical protein
MRAEGASDRAVARDSKQCKIDAEGKGAGRGFTVASLHVKAAKVVIFG